MSNRVYCMYCGDNSFDVKSLVTNNCRKNPEGTKHALYEGSKKDKYTCKYCGDRYSDLKNLTNSSCRNSPSKYHIPSIN